MVRKIFLAALSVVWMIPSWAWTHAEKESIVDVQVVSDQGKEFSKYKVYPQVRQEGNFFYVEAVKGAKYSIRVKNRSGRRVGVVIAVDGRNIIDGRKSELSRNERMYIIGPYQSNSLEGWRTGMDRTNRFYFTESSDSYAEKTFADASAMGTIALAVYKEKLPEIIPYSERQSRMKDAPARAAPSAPSESLAAGKDQQKRSEEAGTGFGETTYSPSRVVHFDPEPLACERVVLKYEWRSELCRKGVVSCGPRNRLWPDDQEFAPIPKDFNG